MIYLITGVPGSGKTLYAVSTLLKLLLGQAVKRPDGSLVQRRLVVEGIPGLTVPHELMDVPVSFASDRQPLVPGEGDGLWNWPDWVKPGDIVCVDEVQRYWRPRGMGTKPSKDVTELETHRHYGIDMVFITQNPMLLDQNVRRLVGRHLHVRRLFGSGRALVYEWDACQSDVSRVQGATKTIWSYPRGAFAQYKSSELHTKQNHKIPRWLLAVLLIVPVAAIAMGPKAYDAMHHAMSGKSITTAPAAGVPSPVVQPATLPARRPEGAPSPVVASSAPPAALVALAKPKVKLVGCIAYRERCSCFDTEGDQVELSPAMCADRSERVGSLLLGGGGAGPAPSRATRHEAATEPPEAAASTPRSSPPDASEVHAGPSSRIAP